MSTKIYDAWRLPSSRTNEFLEQFRGQVFDLIADWIRPLVEVWEESKEFSAHDLYNLIGSQHNSRERSTFEDCGLWLTLDGEWVYIRVYGPYRITEKIEMPDWVDDYHYQNSTDRPTEVSEEEWGQRREDWDRLGKLPSLSFPVFDYRPRNGGYSITKELDRRLEAGWSRVAILHRFDKQAVFFRIETSRHHADCPGVREDPDWCEENCESESSLRSRVQEAAKAWRENGGGIP